MKIQPTNVPIIETGSLFIAGINGNSIANFTGKIKYPPTIVMKIAGKEFSRL